MGLGFHALHLLAYAKNDGAEFAKVCTIGRQGLHISPDVLAWALREIGSPRSDAEIASLYATGFCEDLLKSVFGAETVDSMDASSYEGATLVHDLNVPLDDPPTFDVVMDFGTLEHVFNAPAALSTMIRMCRAGGRIIHVLPCNNFCGHGFWQFSPELFFSLYSKERGFDALDVFVARESETLHWRKVRSTLEKKDRVLLTNSFETFVLVVARKAGEATDPLAVAPQQSDYEGATWVEGGEGDRHSSERSSAASRMDYHLSRLGLRQLFKYLVQMVRRYREQRAAPDYETVPLPAQPRRSSPGGA